MIRLCDGPVVPCQVLDQKIPELRVLDLLPFRVLPVIFLVLKASPGVDRVIYAVTLREYADLGLLGEPLEGFYDRKQRDSVFRRVVKMRKSLNYVVRMCRALYQIY